RNYKILVNEIVIQSSNKDYYSDETIMEMNRFNDTTDTINALLDQLQDLPQETQVYVHNYELHGNKWMESGYEINQTWCDFINTDEFIMKELLSKGNYPHECPINAMKYEIKDFLIDEEQLPEELPGEFWRFVFEQSVGGANIIVFQFDVQIKRNSYK
ncbi:hypothetical protein L9F63_023196, partial [Diploptera punctata]